MEYSPFCKALFENLRENCVANVREESGINFSGAVDCEENDNGFKINVYFQIMQTGISKTKIKIDITKLGHSFVLFLLQNIKCNTVFRNRPIKFDKITIFTIIKVKIKFKRRNLCQRLQQSFVYLKKVK